MQAKEYRIQNNMRKFKRIILMILAKLLNLDGLQEIRHIQDERLVDEKSLYIIIYEHNKCSQMLIYS